MSLLEIPYRAAGTFTGETYIERKADKALAREIRGNQRFPYVVAPRQSGKSSLLVRTLEGLSPKECRGALVDLSPLPLDDYEKFWRLFLVEVARSAKLSQDCIDAAEPEDTFRIWLGQIPERLVVFVDEIDALIGAPFRDLFFSKIRSLFNQRARDKELRRLQFVLAGAAHPSRLIQDQMRSPFNVGVEIALDALSVEQVEMLVLHLRSAAKEVVGDVGQAIFAVTLGLPFLCQLVLERLWLVAEEQHRIGTADVENVINEIVEGASRDIHFTNIYEIVAYDPKLLEDLARLLEGKPILQDRARELRLSGLTDGSGPFLNPLYRRVFGRHGPLDLESLAPRTAPSFDEVLVAPGGSRRDSSIAPAAPPASAPAAAKPSIASAMAHYAPAPPKPRLRALDAEMALESAPAPPAEEQRASLSELISAEKKIEAKEEKKAEIDDIELAPITQAAPKQEAAFPETDAKPIEKAKEEKEEEEEEEEREEPIANVAKEEKPSAIAPHPSKTAVLPIKPASAGSRLGPVVGMLSFAAAAVIALFLAEKNGYLPKGDIDTPTRPSSSVNDTSGSAPIPTESASAATNGATIVPALASATPVAPPTASTRPIATLSIPVGVASHQKPFDPLGIRTSTARVESEFAGRFPSGTGSLVDPWDSQPAFSPLPKGFVCPAEMAAVRNSFCLDRTEVTVAQYQQCVSEKQCEPSSTGKLCNASRGAEFLNHPINCVSFAQAEKYCKTYQKRLPTDAEWERAARGTHERLFPWGDEAPSEERARVSDSPIEPEKTTIAVGSLKNGATPDGIFDLAGNVSEWTLTTACGGEAECKRRIVRGASFSDWMGWRELLPARPLAENASLPIVGFRCVKTANENE